jgi:hypothetical protein
VYRRHADRAIAWSQVIERTFVAGRVESAEFTGWRSALLLKTVREPLWIEFRGAPRCVADNGYLWVQYFPDSAGHTVTSMFDGRA